MKPYWIVALAAALVLIAVAAGYALLRPEEGKWSAEWQEGDPTFTTPTNTPPIVGVNYHGIWNGFTAEERADMLDSFVASGVEWVRMDIAWGSLQPDGPDSFDQEHVAEIDTRLREMNSRGIKTLMMFYWAPSWSSGTTAKNGVPRNAQEYADAAAWVAQRWAGQLQGIELWNEPDLETFLANTSVETYTELLKAAYPAIKAANPDITVVAGSPTGTDVDWYARMYELGGGGMFDALGIHPYMGSAEEPPTACDVKYIKYYPCNIPNLIRLMEANGDGDKTIWATEYGWSSHSDSDYPGAVQPWNRGVTEEQQAQYLIEAQQVFAQWPQVEASFWYTDRNTGNPDPHQANFGLLTQDIEPKPAWFAMRCAAGDVCGP